MTYDGTTGQYAIYLNGQQVATGTGGGSLLTSDANVLIGHEASSVPRPFIGFIDEVHIFNRALSASEIKAIYDAGGAGLPKP